MDHRQELANFVAITTRQQRYRLAGKTLRFSVYRSIEALVAACFVLVVALAAANAGEALANWVGALVVVLALGHFARLVAEKPWLPLAAAFEAVAVWAAYAWWLSSYVSIPHFGVLSVFLCAVRFWQRGEGEISVAALLTARSVEGSKDRE